MISSARGGRKKGKRHHDKASLHPVRTKSPKRKTPLKRLRERIAALEGEGGRLLTALNGATHANELLVTENERLRTALEFYADPGTYHAIAFLAYPPYGAFSDDFSEHDDPDYPEGNMKPGARARAALAGRGK